MANQLKLKAKLWVRSGIGGRKRSFNTVSEGKIKKMMEVSFQDHIEAKIKWAVNCYNAWRDMRLDHGVCDLEIVNANLLELLLLMKENLEYSLVRFICEVKKSKQKGDYPGRTLYELAMSLQLYLKKKGFSWKLVHGNEFQNFQHVLDKVMQERANLALGYVHKRAQVISLEVENELWERQVLGEDTPDKLRSTVLFLIGINCALRAGNEHYVLRRPGGCTGSQFSFEMNSQGQRCLVYHEDSVTKTNRGGIRDLKKERKIVWVKPSSNLLRCPVPLIEKHMKLLPQTGCKLNLYLQTLRRTKPNCWYSTVPVGINSIRKVVASLLKDAGLDGYLTNHSLRCTCATRLFQAGESTKLVKEVTGHVLDAVEKYQETSEEQRMRVSNIIHGDVEVKQLSEAAPLERVEGPKSDNLEAKCKLECLNLAELQPKKSEEGDGNVKLDEIKGKFSKIIEAAVSSVGDRRATITVKVELN